MVIKCAVFGCSNRKDREKELQFYRLPAVIANQGTDCEKLSRERRLEWLARLGQCFENKNLGNVRVCSAHFVSGKKAELYDRNNPDWSPTINLGKQLQSTTIMVNRYHRLQGRQKRKAEQHSILEELTHEKENLESQEKQKMDISTQTELTGRDLDCMARELQALRTENLALNEKVSVHDSKFSQKDLESDDEKVKFLTGIVTFSMLMRLYTFIEHHLTVRPSLDKFKMFILTLMRLRLNLSIQFLSYEFNISQSTVSRIISDVIDVMYVRTGFLVHWPDRESLQKTMPLQFRRYFGKRCSVIIDCFEVFLERPSNLEARAETWSSYKHHNTVKFLIGITPQGSVSFLSRAWGGRVSDKEITENSGFLDYLLPGDLILADRGFNIEESVGSVSAQLKIPAFTKGRNQLSAVDVETTRKIANVRIHVERVIGMVSISDHVVCMGLD